MSEAKEIGGSKVSPSAHTRRRVLRAAFTAAVAVTGTTAALHPIVTAGTSRAGKPEAGGGSGPGPAPAPAAGAFDEIYRGRRIQGVPTGTADGAATEGSPVVILIDGRLLHVMRRADGSYLSVANHYQPYATPLDTARGAVDVIGGAKLSLAGGSFHQ